LNKIGYCAEKKIVRIYNDNDLPGNE
jgi:hypothetical protein